MPASVVTTSHRDGVPLEIHSTTTTTKLDGKRGKGLRFLNKMKQSFRGGGGGKKKSNSFGKRKSFDPTAVQVKNQNEEEKISENPSKLPVEEKVEEEDPILSPKSTHSTTSSVFDVSDDGELVVTTITELTPTKPMIKLEEHTSANSSTTEGTVVPTSVMDEESKEGEDDGVISSPSISKAKQQQVPSSQPENTDAVTTATYTTNEDQQSVEITTEISSTKTEDGDTAARAVSIQGSDAGGGIPPSPSHVMGGRYIRGDWDGGDWDGGEEKKDDMDSLYFFNHTMESVLQNNDVTCACDDIGEGGDEGEEKANKTTKVDRVPSLRVQKILEKYDAACFACEVDEQGEVSMMTVQEDEKNKDPTNNKERNVKKKKFDGGAATRAKYPIEESVKRKARANFLRRALENVLQGNDNACMTCAADPQIYEDVQKDGEVLEDDDDDIVVRPPGHGPIPPPSVPALLEDSDTVAATDHTGFAAGDGDVVAKEEEKHMKKEVLPHRNVIEQDATGQWILSGKYDHSKSAAAAAVAKRASKDELHYHYDDEDDVDMIIVEQQRCACGVFPEDEEEEIVQIDSVRRQQYTIKPQQPQPSKQSEAVVLVPPAQRRGKNEERAATLKTRQSDHVVGNGDEDRAVPALVAAPANTTFALADDNSVATTESRDSISSNGDVLVL